VPAKGLPDLRIDLRETEMRRKFANERIAVNSFVRQQNWQFAQRRENVFSLDVL